tara:strand:- start:639 stop:1310 length:672 start_codon:yes stop_codon:yes gene_type:complete
MIKKYINKNSLFYKPYLYFRIFWIEKFFLKRNSYSQCGEDLFISQFFKNKRKGKYVDLGAFNPIKYNNTYLLYQKGWTGINVDLNQTSIDLFNIIRKKDKNILAAVSNKKENTKMFMENIFSPLNTIAKNFNNQISKKNFKYVKTKMFKDIVKYKIDFLNIDIEGMDFKVLRTINLNYYKPKLICIEIFGFKNIKRVKKYLKIKKYSFAKKVGPSYFFASKNT